MKNLYCVYDQVAKICGNVITCSNDDLITRDFKIAASKGMENLEDLCILRLGKIDEETGEITAMPIETVIYGMTLLEDKKVEKQ